MREPPPSPEDLVLLSLGVVEEVPAVKEVELAKDLAVWVQVGLESVRVV